MSLAVVSLEEWAIVRPLVMFETGEFSELEVDEPMDASEWGAPVSGSAVTMLATVRS